MAFLVYSKEQWKGGNRGNERGNEHNAKDTNETAVELLRSSVEANFSFYGESACAAGGKGLVRTGNVRRMACMRGARFTAGRHWCNGSNSPVERLGISGHVRCGQMR